MKKYLKLNYFIIAALVLVIIYLMTCKKKVVEIEPVTPVSVQKERVRVDSVASVKYQDSVKGLISYWEGIATEKEQENDALAQVNLGLQLNMDSVLSQPLPDTCKPYQMQVASLQRRLAQSTAQAQAACEQTVKAKDNIIAQKDAIMSKKNQDYAKLRSALDTAWAAQTTLTKQLKALKPKRDVYIGAQVIGSETKYLAAYGVNLGLRNKKGTMYEVGAFQMGSQVYYQAAVKKTIF